MAAEGGGPTADLEGAASAPEEQAANGAVERPGRASGDHAPTDPSPAPPLAGPEKVARLYKAMEPAFMVSYMRRNPNCWDDLGDFDVTS